MENFEKRLINELKALRDEGFKEFNCKLIPNVDKNSVIGVRTPDMRKLAKTLYREGGYECFLADLPHKYHEEYFIHAMLIEQIKDFDEAVVQTEKFLPFVNNWAVCDSLSPKCFGKHKEELLNKIRLWLCATDTYTVRFSLKMLMTHFLDADFQPEYLELAANVDSEEYYIKMMQSWYFATALAKQYGSAVEYLNSNRLPVWIHNKTIQKAVESYRITDSRKSYLKGLRIK